MDIKLIIKQFVISTLLKLSGLRAWVASVIFNKLWKYVENKYQHIKQQKDERQKLNEHLKIINNPNSTDDDVRRSDTDFLS